MFLFLHCYIDPVHGIPDPGRVFPPGSKRPRVEVRLPGGTENPAWIRVLEDWISSCFTFIIIVLMRLTRVYDLICVCVRAYVCVRVRVDGRDVVFSKYLKLSKHKRDLSAGGGCR